MANMDKSPAAYANSLLTHALLRDAANIDDGDILDFLRGFDRLHEGLAFPGFDTCKFISRSKLKSGLGCIAPRYVS